MIVWLFCLPWAAIFVAFCLQIGISILFLDVAHLNFLMLVDGQVTDWSLRLLLRGYPIPFIGSGVKLSCEST